MPRSKKQKPRERDPLYVYVSPSSRKRAMTYGRAKFGTASQYVDRLIAADRRGGGKEKRSAPRTRETAKAGT